MVVKWLLISSAAIMAPDLIKRTTKAQNFQQTDISQYTTNLDLQGLSPEDFAEKLCSLDSDSLIKSRPSTEVFSLMI
jgi:hypothetical protein